MNFYQCKIFTNNYLFFTTQYWIFTINVKITQNRAQSFIKLCNCIVCSPYIYRTIQTLFVDLKNLLLFITDNLVVWTKHSIEWPGKNTLSAWYTFASFLDTPVTWWLFFVCIPLTHMYCCIQYLISPMIWTVTRTNILTVNYLLKCEYLRISVIYLASY